MTTPRKFQWGVLIYACGNNDLEPEITASVLSLFKTDRFKDVSVAVQLGRAPRELIAVLRPGFKDQFPVGEWHGVRRFLREGGSGYYKSSDLLNPVEDLGNLNMACPKSLRDFLIWASRAVNAKQYMVVLSGHGAGFIGSLADFSHDRPQIMGVSQMSKAISMAFKHTGEKARYLLMDACYMNLVENAYELARHKIAKIFLGSGGFVPLKGYDYRLFIERFCGKKFISNKKAIEVNNDSLNGVEATLLDKNLLTLLKQQLSGLAGRLISLGISPSMLNTSDETLICLSELINKILNDFSTDPTLNEFSNKILKLIRKINLTSTGIKIFCPGRQETFAYFAKYYYSLSFSRNNLWPLWLSGRAPPVSDTIANSFSSTFLPLEILTEHLLNLNTGMTIKEAGEIYRKLGWI